MKKQFISLLLLFVFVLGLGSPAAAYEEGSIHGTDVECVEIGAEASSKTKTTVQSDFAANSTRARMPDVYVSAIDVSPIVHIGDLDHYLCFTDFGARQTFTATNGGIGQFKGIDLTSSQINNICSKLYTALQSSQYAGQSVRLVGWKIITTVNYAADNPQYLEYETGDMCMEGATHKIDLGRQQVSYRNLEHNFLIKEGTYQSRYTFGARGAFYFSSGGQSGGAGFSGSVTFNSDKSLPN